MSNRKRKDEKRRTSPLSKKTRKRILSLSSPEENSHVSSPMLVSFPFFSRRSGILGESYSFQMKEGERSAAVHGREKKKKTVTGKLVKQNLGEEIGWF